jgi:hypothetical protein
MTGILGREELGGKEIKGDEVKLVLYSNCFQVENCEDIK